PLIWDEFAIGTYFTVSTVFLIMGLIPDIAAVRDLATGWRKKLYAITGLGWRGSNEEWRHYTRGYLYLAALATPLVLSVHSVVAWFGGNPDERAAFWYRAFGPFWWASWTMIICNGFLPQLLWFKKIRTNIIGLFVISIFVNVGMWFERYVIIVVSLAGEPFSRWANGVYNPTWADWGIMAGSFGWFFMWFLLFVKNFPAVSISEVKEVLPPPQRVGAH